MEEEEGTEAEAEVEVVEGRVGGLWQAETRQTAGEWDGERVHCWRHNLFKTRFRFSPAAPSYCFRRSFSRAVRYSGNTIISFGDTSAAHLIRQWHSSSLQG